MDVLRHAADAVDNLATEAADADLNGAFTSAETFRATEYLFDAHSLTGLPQVLTETEKNAAGALLGNS